MWIFSLSGLDVKSSFPAGFADEHEAESLTAGGEFIGGSGMVQVCSNLSTRSCHSTGSPPVYQVVSYSTSPVGMWYLQNQYVQSAQH